MKFIVDAQLFQTDTWDRGMGKYSLELIKALQNQGYFDEYKVELIFNSNLTLDKDRYKTFQNLLPKARIVELDLKLNQGDLYKVQRLNRQVLGRRYNNVEDIFLIMSVFENKVTSVFPVNARKIMLAYDLIPVFFYERYLAYDENTRLNYFGRFNTIFEADHIFTISQTTKDDFIRQLGLPDSKLTNINGARINLTKTVKAPTNIPKHKFIISPSGDDQRKNNNRMVEAFAQYNDEFGKKLELIITSNFTPQTKARLNKISPHVRFVGNVPEEELNWYYQNAEMLLFVPEYEGLGLPILEAIEFNQKVVCSDISVFREITTKTKVLNFCDPNSADSIKNALSTTLEKGNNVNKAEYQKIRNKYSWAVSAKEVSQVCRKLSNYQPVGDRKKIAVIGPNPAGKSAIGKVIEITHYELSKLVDIDYYFELPKDHETSDKHSYLEYTASIQKIADFNAEVASHYDGIIYHLGSSTYHLKSIIEALAIPGVIILHDTRFEGAFKCLLSDQIISQVRFDAEEELDNLLDVTDSSDHVISLVNEAYKTVAHSEHAIEAFQLCLINKQADSLFQADLPIGLASQPTTKQESHKIKIAMAGIISKAKGLEVLTDLLKSDKMIENEFLLFGYDFAVDPILLNQMENYSNLTIKRNLTELEFRQQLKQADILLNYREYYHGETSYATLEAMREGVVPIVRDIGWYSELPNYAVKKVTAPNQVESIIEQLTSDRGLLNSMSKKAYQYVADNHSPARYAHQLFELL